MGKLYILCGLIGSGKTTFALSNFDYFTDLDYMNKWARKQDQINWTKKLLKKNLKVCHITTVPSEEEIEELKIYNPKFILIDTSINQCKKNILIRNRERDMQNLHSVFNANLEIEKKLIEFSKKINSIEKIKVFR